MPALRFCTMRRSTVGRHHDTLADRPPWSIARGFYFLRNRRCGKLRRRSKTLSEGLEDRGRRDDAVLTVVNDKSIYRAIVDARDVDRIKQQTGLYILYSEKTYFIRGNYS